MESPWTIWIIHAAIRHSLLALTRASGLQFGTCLAIGGCEYIE